MANELAPFLYVEDDDNDVLVVKLGFKRAGISQPMQVVENGNEAVEYLWGNGRFSDRCEYPFPCVVLLDLNLPQLNGFEVLRRIRGELRFKDLPVVIFSSSAQTSDKERALEFGASEYAIKPPNIEGMMAFAEHFWNRWLRTARS